MYIKYFLIFLRFYYSYLGKDLIQNVSLAVALSLLGLCQRNDSMSVSKKSLPLEIIHFEMYFKDKKII